ncbi:MAG: hypothetical protein ACLRL4_06845 [Bifidobacterium bifidum]
MTVKNIVVQHLQNRTTRLLYKVATTQKRGIEPFWFIDSDTTAGQRPQNNKTRQLSSIAVASSIPELPPHKREDPARRRGLVAMDAQADATHAIRQRAADQPKRPEM